LKKVLVLEGGMDRSKSQFKDWLQQSKTQVKILVLTAILKLIYIGLFMLGVRIAG
jgi:hypothetical protein